jgi:hypothetical protein
VLGRFAAVTGVLVIAAVTAAALVGDVPAALAVAFFVVLAGSLALTGLAALRVLRPPPVLELSDGGYQVRVLRRAGPTEASWTDVTRVRSQRLAPGMCLVLSLDDGSRTIVPLYLLEGGTAAADRLETDLRTRLDRSHGRRRLT